MEKKLVFYEKLSPEIKEHYDAQERLVPHTEKFLELMERKPKKNAYSFTDEEIEYLAKEDLPTFSEVFPAEADYYMYELS